MGFFSHMCSPKLRSSGGSHSDRSARHRAGSPKGHRGSSNFAWLRKVGRSQEYLLRCFHSRQISSQFVSENSPSLGIRHQQHSPRRRGRVARTCCELVETRRYPTDSHWLDDSISEFDSIKPGDLALESGAGINRHERGWWFSRLALGEKACFCRSW
jgi:hypothetical protein